MKGGWKLLLRGRFAHLCMRSGPKEKMLFTPHAITTLFGTLKMRELDMLPHNRQPSKSKRSQLFVQSAVTY